MKRITKEMCKAKLLSLWKGWGRPFLVVIIVLSTFRSAVADWNDVPTGSMRPTILEGDRIFVNKLAYDLKIPFTSWPILEWAGPRRGDVVVCFAPATGERLVKRVVAVPGDTIEMRNNRLLINGQPVTYRTIDHDGVHHAAAGEHPQPLLARETIGPGTHTIMITPGVRAMRSFAPLTVPPDRYFVMGDNRDASRDSRFFGFVARRHICGRASAVVLSLAPDDHYLPRWHRFFHKLR
ncbi:MAG: signal peptidase I [Phycisphaerales bacterium]|nr:MAG: signal peptidase I [Phycisphaerales bacterium]